MIGDSLEVQLDPECRMDLGRDNRADQGAVKGPWPSLTVGLLNRPRLNSVAPRVSKGRASTQSRTGL